MFVRAMTLALVCFASAPAAYAAVYQCQNQKFYDPTLAETSNATAPANAALSGLTVTGGPAHEVTLKFKQPSGSSTGWLDQQWFSGQSAGVVFRIDGVLPSDLLVQAPAGVPSICGKQPFFGTPAQAAVPSVQAVFNAENNAPTSPAEASPLAPSDMPSYSALGGLPTGYSGLSLTVGFAVIDSTQVPEPSSLAIFGLGLAAIAAAMQFRQRQTTVA